MCCFTPLHCSSGAWCRIWSQTRRGKIEDGGSSFALGCSLATCFYDLVRLALLFVVVYLTTLVVTNQLWSISTTTLRVRLRLQLNSILFAKTLVRKDVASSAKVPEDDSKQPGSEASSPAEEGKNDAEFSTKAQVMTLMTTDVDRVSEFSQHLFAIVGKLRFTYYQFFLLTVP